MRIFKNYYSAMHFEFPPFSAHDAEVFTESYRYYKDLGETIPHGGEIRVMLPSTVACSPAEN